MLDHSYELPDLGLGLARVAVEQPLHDLSLESDVGEALSRTVVHGPRDLAAQVFLSSQDQPRDCRGQGRACVELVRGVLGNRTAHRSPVQFGAVAPQALAVPAENLQLALQDVDLRFHDGRALGQGDELIGLILLFALGVLAGRLELLRRLGASLFVTRGLGAGLVDEQLDLADLPGQEVDFSSGSLRDL